MRSDRLRLLDVLDAIDEVARYLPAEPAAFHHDPLLQSHIYRHMMVLGEAIWHLSKPLKARHPQIPWKQIEGTRHIMVHDYFKVDWNIVFEAARVDVPALRPRIEAILATLPPEDEEDTTP